MTSLTWDQVDAWRMARNHLTVPASVDDLPGVVRRACGIQAQVLSAAELALSARIPDLRVADVRAALWERRTLVKVHGLRSTIHLVGADDVSLHMAAMRAHPWGRDGAWLKFHGLDPSGAGALLAAIGDALDDRRLTREELAVEVAARAGAWALDAMRSNWGSLLGPAAFAGLLCFGPSQGAKVTFVRLDQWIDAWEDLDPEASMVEIVRRFLRAYGPAAEVDVAAWLGVRPAEARPFLDALRPELAAVGVEGRAGWCLADDLDDIGDLDDLDDGDYLGGAPPPAMPTLRLLPQYDSYILGHRQRDRLVPPPARARIAADPKGRLEHVVGVSTMLVDGVVGGIWKRTKRGRRMDIAVDPTTELTATHLDLLDREVARIAAFLDVEAALVGS